MAIYRPDECYFMIGKRCFIYPWEDIKMDKCCWVEKLRGWVSGEGYDRSYGYCELEKYDVMHDRLRDEYYGISLRYEKD